MELTKSQRLIVSLNYQLNLLKKSIMTFEDVKNNVQAYIVKEGLTDEQINMIIENYYNKRGIFVKDFFY